MKLILPNNFIEAESINYPLFFLAGPIRGGGNWQEKACVELGKQLKEFFVAVPCRWSSQDKLFLYRTPGEDGRFPSQTAWEHYYQALAAERSRRHKGCIIFWLPVESRAQPRQDGQPYSRDTYGELGSWRRNIALDPSIHLAIGAESDFPGLSVIQKNFDLETKKEFCIHATLEETILDAVKLVTSN